MKSILLTSTALVAFAGAAAAEVTFTGSATLGYNAEVDYGNNVTSGGDNDGFYWDANVAVTLSQELDNGLTASATFDFDVAEDNTGEALSSGSYLLSISSDTAALFFGDTAFAAETYWASAGDMESDSFSEADGEVVLRGEATFGGVTAGLSYAVADNEGTYATDDVNQLSLGATGEFGNFTVAVAYQEEADEDFSKSRVNFDEDGVAEEANGDFNSDEVFGISASTTFSGATVSAAYATNLTDETTSMGVKVAYPFGPVTATVYYVSETAEVGDPEDNYGVNVAYESGPIAVALDFQDDQGTQKTALDASYDVGNGITAYAGMYMEDDKENEFYVAGSYDLGGGASILVSYAEAEDDGDDEVGTNDYQQGTTVEVSFEF